MIIRNHRIECITYFKDRAEQQDCNGVYWCSYVNLRGGWLHFYRMWKTSWKIF